MLLAHKHTHTPTDRAKHIALKRIYHVPIAFDSYPHLVCLHEVCLYLCEMDTKQSEMARDQSVIEPPVYSSSMLRSIAIVRRILFGSIFVFILVYV